jgi:phosphatidylserine/phosphatidylglycerophosphate/cardiolipin synthase-like enzyme
MKNRAAQNTAIHFVEDIPGEYIDRITDLLQKETSFDLYRILHRLQASVPQVDVQEKIRSFVSSWGNLSPIPTPSEMALMILTIDSALEYQSQKQSVELTWTGPKTREVNLRRTDQALIELINSSTQRVIIVSFAVYRTGSVMTALEKAFKRNVKIDIIIESADASEGKITYDTIAALGLEMKSKANIFIWPYSKRETTPNGKYGALHAKVAVGDQNCLYISSANLTDYAMNLNMEMGVLVTGGNLPVQVQKHFDELISRGVLTQIVSE